MGVIAMNIWMIIGLILTVAMILGLSIYSGTKFKAGGSKNGSAITAGIIMGTLVGGSSTVGTAQLAYNYGMSAWWFTLGGGIACLVLALVYVKPFRNSHCATLVQMIGHEYGAAAGLSASILNSVGTFINIISQLIAATAVITVLFPNLSMVVELLIAAAFMVLYVVFGGAKGAGMVGVLKLVLLYIAMIGCGIIVLTLTGGVGGFVDMVKGIDNPEGIHFFSLVARGAGKDVGACLSLIFGVLTTQTYAQAVISCKSDACARKGAVMSAFLIPPIGIGGILVGLYMRATHPGIVAKTALTSFVMEQMPPAQVWRWASRSLSTRISSKSLPISWTTIRGWRRFLARSLRRLCCCWAAACPPVLWVIRFCSLPLCPWAFAARWYWCPCAVPCGCRGRFPTSLPCAPLLWRRCWCWFLAC